MTYLIEELIIKLGILENSQWCLVSETETTTVCCPVFYHSQLLSNIGFCSPFPSSQNTFNKLQHT